MDPGEWQALANSAVQGLAGPALGAAPPAHVPAHASAAAAGAVAAHPAAAAAAAAAAAHAAVADCYQAESAGAASMAHPAPRGGDAAHGARGDASGGDGRAGGERGADGGGDDGGGDGEADTEDDASSEEGSALQSPHKPHTRGDGSGDGGDDDRRTGRDAGAGVGDSGDLEPQPPCAAFGGGAHVGGSQQGGEAPTHAHAADAKGEEAPGGQGGVPLLQAQPPFLILAQPGGAAAPVAVVGAPSPATAVLLACGLPTPVAGGQPLFSLRPGEFASFSGAASEPTADSRPLAHVPAALLPPPALLLHCGCCMSPAAGMQALLPSALEGAQSHEPDAPLPRQGSQPAAALMATAPTGSSAMALPGMAPQPAKAPRRRGGANGGKAAGSSDGRRAAGGSGSAGGGGAGSGDAPPPRPRRSRQPAKLAEPPSPVGAAGGVAAGAGGGNGEDQEEREAAAPLTPQRRAWLAEITTTGGFFKPCEHCPAVGRGEGARAGCAGPCMGETGGVAPMRHPSMAPAGACWRASASPQAHAPASR
jgi:hypothetical protein